MFKIALNRMKFVDIYSQTESHVQVRLAGLCESPYVSTCSKIQARKHPPKTVPFGWGSYKDFRIA